MTDDLELEPTDEDADDEETAPEAPPTDSVPVEDQGTDS